MPFPVQHIRRQFSTLSQLVDGNPLVYLDNAATTQKPQCVLDAMTNFYAKDNANINRGVHLLAERATIAYDNARITVQRFLNARHAHEVLFTRNATEAINLVARSWGDANVKKGDTIVLSLLEHHSNIVPWQQLKERTGCELRWLVPNAVGELEPAALKKVMQGKNVKMLAITGMSNVLGSIPSLAEMIAIAHKAGAVVCVDAAQLVAHRSIDVQALDCDFLAFSGHKIYGPTGIGVLYGKHGLLSNMPSFLGGGDMIQTVTTDGFTPAELPRKFEAGTPAIAEAIGLAAAIEWLEGVTMHAIAEHEAVLIEHAVDRLSSIPTLKMLGSTKHRHRIGCVSFTIDGLHPHDVTEILGRQGVCLRAGHHCTQPLHNHLKINASARLSVAAYNTLEEIDQCTAALNDALKFLRG